MPLAHRAADDAGVDLMTGRPPCPGRTPPDAFRLTIHDSASEFRVAVEGRLTVSGAAEMEQCWRTASTTLGGRRFVIDAGRLAGIDDAARGILDRLRKEGAQWIAAPQRMSFAEILSCLASRFRLWISGRCAHCAR